MLETHLLKHFFISLALLPSLLLLPVDGQETEFYKAPTNPKEFWRALQFEIALGKFDLAATHLKGLIDSKPTEKDLLEIEAKDGLVPFLRLRNVERWSPNKKADEEVRENVETLIKMVSEALKKELSNPARITKFAKNLSATPEEAAFAQKELMRSGVDAIPVLIDLLRSDQQPSVRAAVLNVLPQFDQVVVPPLVAALDAEDVGLRLELLESLRKRRDYLTLPFKVETDPVPHLWLFTADLKANPEPLRARAREMLKDLLPRDPSADRNTENLGSAYRLIQFARKFLDHQARFATPVNVFVWKWDGAKPVSQGMSVSDAEEYYGLRFARWALEIKPDYADAQKLFLTLALEKHFARAGDDAPLAKSSPNLYAILATAPYDLISQLLETALQERRAPTAVALVQVLGDRTEVKAARPSEKPGSTEARPEIRKSLLMKALDDPDRRVQFAAAEALLKSPLPHTHQRSAQIIKILTGWLLADPPEPGTKPKVMIGDQDPQRAQALAQVIRQAGYSVETGRTGKEVIRRLQEKSDIDLVMVDQHLQLPALQDFLVQFRADFRTRGIPIVVIASPEKQATAHPITLLARLAALTAAAEHFDNIQAQQESYDPRRDAPSFRFQKRLDSLRKLVEATGIVVSGDVADRLEYLVFLTTPPNPMDFPAEQPELEKSRLIIQPADRLNRMNVLRNDPKKGHIAPDEPPFSDTKRLTPILAEATARYENSLSREVLEIAKRYWDVMQSGQVEKDGRIVQPPLPAVSIRNPEVEARLARLTRGYQRLRVIPEVFSERGLKEEIQGFALAQDPKVMEAEKRNNAKASLEWLRKMAIGELPGYSVAESAAALRSALQKPEFASLAIDAVSRLPGKEVQQDIASVVLSPQTPEIRVQAAEALIKHIQQRGKMISGPQQQLLLERATTEESADVKARLLALKGILDANSKQTGANLIGYQPPPPAPPKDEPKEEPKKKEDEPKKDEPKKDEPKKDEPKKKDDEPKKDEPKKDEPKKE